MRHSSDIHWNRSIFPNVPGVNKTSILIFISFKIIFVQIKPKYWWYTSNTDYPVPYNLMLNYIKTTELQVESTKFCLNFLNLHIRLLIQVTVYFHPNHNQTFSVHLSLPVQSNSLILDVSVRNSSEFQISVEFHHRSNILRFSAICSFHLQFLQIIL